MKILIVNNLYHPNIVGGAEKSAQSLAEALTTRGHEVVLATLNPEKRYEVAEVNGVRVYYLPLRNLYFPNTHARPTPIKAVWHAVDSYNPFMAAALGAVLDRERPDVVNTHNICGFSASVWSAVKKRHLPLVHTLRDHYLLCSRSMMFHDDKACANLCTACRVYSQPRRSLSDLVDVVTGVSRTILERHIQYGCFSESEKMVVYNAFEPPSGNGVYAGRNGHLRFGYLGRLHSSKGVDLLIRSFLELPAGKAELLIAGRGTPEYEEELKRLINGIPTIKMLGFVSPSDLLSEVDVTVVPSLCHDCAPRSVLESMAYHLPVIGSCRGGIPELMGEGAGWAFEPDEPGALTQAMHRVIESRAELKGMSERAVERSKQFSAEAMVNGYLKAYADAIQKNIEKAK